MGIYSEGFLQRFVFLDSSGLLSPKLKLYYLSDAQEIFLSALALFIVFLKQFKLHLRYLWAEIHSLANHEPFWIPC